MPPPMTAMRGEAVAGVVLVTMERATSGKWGMWNGECGMWNRREELFHIPPSPCHTLNGSKAPSPRPSPGGRGSLEPYQTWRWGCQGQYDGGWAPNRYSRPNVMAMLCCVGWSSSREM